MRDAMAAVMQTLQAAGLLSFRAIEWRAASFETLLEPTSNDNCSFLRSH